MKNTLGLFEFTIPLELRRKFGKSKKKRAGSRKRLPQPRTDYYPGQRGRLCPAGIGRRGVQVCLQSSPGRVNPRAIYQTRAARTGADRRRRSAPAVGPTGPPRRGFIVGQRRCRYMALGSDRGRMLGFPGSRRAVGGAGPGCGGGTDFYLHYYREGGLKNQDYQEWMVQ